MQILTYPHPTLRYKAKPVKRVDAALRKMVREMFDLMYEARGIGLAATQVDLPFRLFIVNLEADPEEGEELVFLNPVLSRPKGREEGEEGCLSFPDLYGPVLRPKQIDVHAFTLEGNEIRQTLNGMLARVVQHEYDHLDGVVFTDRISPLGLGEIEPDLEQFRSAFENQRARGEIPPDDQIIAKLQEWEQRYC